MDSGIGYIEAPKFPKYVWLDGGNAKQMVWDTSSLSSFSSCPRYYNFQNLLGYKSKIYSTATGFGSAVHDGFEQLAKMDNQLRPTLQSEYGDYSQEVKIEYNDLIKQLKGDK